MVDASVVDRIAAVCDRAQTVCFVAAGGTFLVSFVFAGSGRFRPILLAAFALLGAGFLCGGLGALREPAELVGNTAPSEAGMFGQRGRIRSRSEGRLLGWLFAGIGLVLFLVGGFGALSTL
jgi:hypothetical protein